MKTRERYRSVAYRYFFKVPYLHPNLIDARKERQILEACAGLPSEVNGTRYSGFTLAKKYLSIPADQRAASHLRENERSSEQIGFLRQLLRFSAASNLDVYVIIPPFRSDYTELLPDKSYLFRDIYGLTEANFRLVDLYMSPMFGDDDMGDPDHLNGPGAEKLTRHIASMIAASTA
jgi:hypothetical protein